MSRLYNMTVVIRDHRPEMKDAIVAAANEAWPFEDWDGEDQMSASGDGQLAGGESNEQFAARLAKAIWRANGAACEVDVNSIYLEELPHESFSFDENDYQEMMADGAT